MSVTSPVGVGTGDIAIVYDLADADGDACSIAVEYSGGSAGATWTNATVTGATSGISPEAEKSITWNSWADESGQLADNYRIRITPSDGHATGLPASTDAFSLDNRLKWTFATGSAIETAAAIADDGTVYFANNADNLCALLPNGASKWTHPVGNTLRRSPAVGADGTIYVGSAAHVRAVNPDGSLKWSFVTIGGIGGEIGLALDGTIYAHCGEADLVAVNPDGTEKWYAYGGGRGIGIGIDGVIYYSPDGLGALNPDGTGKWNWPPGDSFDSHLAIGADGTIYAGREDGKLYAVNPDGSEKWAFDAGAGKIHSTVIAADGTLYAACATKLYAVNPDGTDKWSFAAAVTPRTAAAVGQDGTIFFGSSDAKLYALNSEGTLGWTLTTGGAVASPTIAGDGTVYVGSADGKLYAVATTCEGPGDTPWPMFHHDAKHTARVGAPIKLAVLHVPTSEYPTIQEAIDAAKPGGKIVVAPGEYWETLNFHGKSVVVESEEGSDRTVIVGLDDSAPAVDFSSGEDAGAVLKGFTIKGGSVAVRVRSSGPMLSGNLMLSGLDCDSLLTGRLIRARNAVPGPKCALVEDLRRVDVANIAAWLTREPRAFFAELEDCLHKAQATGTITAPISRPHAQEAPPVLKRMFLWVILLCVLAGVVITVRAAKRRGLFR